MKYEVRFTSQFKKDVKLAKKQGKDIDKLLGVIEDLLLIRANRFWKAIFVAVIASKPCHTSVCLRFSASTDSEKSHLTKLLRT